MRQDTLVYQISLERLMKSSNLEGFEILQSALFNQNLKIPVKGIYLSVSPIGKINNIWIPASGKRFLQNPNDPAHPESFDVRITSLSYDILTEMLALISTRGDLSPEDIPAFDKAWYWSTL